MRVWVVNYATEETFHAAEDDPSDFVDELEKPRFIAVWAEDRFDASLAELKDDVLAELREWENDEDGELNGDTVEWTEGPVRSDDRRVERLWSLDLKACPERDSLAYISAFLVEVQ